MRVLSELKKKPHSSAVLSMIKQQNQILASRQRQIKQGDILPDSCVCVCVCVLDVPSFCARYLDLTHSLIYTGCRSTLRAVICHSHF